MARTIGALCTMIVCLQILIGVPVVVCAGFFCLTGGGLGPFTVEVQSSHGNPPQLMIHGATIPPPAAPFAATPPPNAIPVAPVGSLDNPILASRVQHGSPLAGTVLEASDPADEQSTFVAALEKAASEHMSHSPSSAASQHAIACPVGNEPQPSFNREETERFIIRHLYDMADIDERASEFLRADQWRAFAREMRAAQTRDGAPPSAANAAFESPAARD